VGGHDWEAGNATARLGEGAAAEALSVQTDVCVHGYEWTGLGHQSLPYSSAEPTLSDLLWLTISAMLLFLLLLLPANYFLSLLLVRDPSEVFGSKSGTTPTVTSSSIVFRELRSGPPMLVPADITSTNSIHVSGNVRLG
jgi:hypothetical protein